MAWFFFLLMTGSLLYLSLKAVSLAFLMPGLLFEAPFLAALLYGPLCLVIFIVAKIGLSSARRVSQGYLRFLQGVTAACALFIAGAIVFNADFGAFLIRLNDSRFALERRAREMAARDEGWGRRQWIGWIPVIDSYRDGDYVVFRTHSGLMNSFGVAVDVSGSTSPRGNLALLDRDARIAPPLIGVIFRRPD
jgi:hypothetical protein